MTDERDRQSILARRRFFVASALAGIAAAGCDNKAAQPCLKVASPPVADAAPASPPTATAPESEGDAGAPQPCLSPLPPPTTDSDAQAIVDPPAPSARPAQPEPPKPLPCLKVAIPRDTNLKR